MSKAKVVKLYKDDRYQGSLSDETCEVLDQLLELDSANGCVSDLRHVIYDLSKSSIAKIKEYGFNWENMKDIEDVEMKRGTLEDSQTIGVAYMYWAEKCLLGDSVGMGKTPMSVGLCNLLKMRHEQSGKPFRFLFLCEKVSIFDIQDKLIQFSGDFVDVCLGEAPSTKKFIARNGDYPHYSVVGTHSLIKQGLFIDWMMSHYQMYDALPFDIIIVDESSVVAGAKTGFFEGIEAWSKLLDRVIFLNATPVESHALSMYNQLSLLDPSFLPPKYKWSAEFEEIDHRGMYPRPSGKYKNPEVFQHRCEYRYFARTRKDKGAVMEGCTGAKLLSDLSPVQRYWLSRSSIPQLVFDAPNYFDSSIEFCSDTVPKLKSLLFLLENDCENATSIIIFTHYKFTLDSLSNWLSDMGISNKVLNGDVIKAEDKQTIISNFRAKNFRILLTNVQKGLDFGDCDYCIFYSFDPNPSKMVQQEGRLERSFNIYNKHVYLLVSRGKELNRLNGVIRDRAVGAVGFTKTDFSLIRDIILGEEYMWDVAY